MAYGGLTYKISQVSLVVRDIDATMAAYHEAFGWGPWKVYDHVAPVHHDTQIDGQPVEFSLRGAEVMVGDMNFELLQPLNGPSKWQEFLDTKGEGIMSIAVMFDTTEESDTCKAAFAEHGIGATMGARIGDHTVDHHREILRAIVGVRSRRAGQQRGRAGASLRAGTATQIPIYLTTRQRSESWAAPFDGLRVRSHLLSSR